MQRTSPVHYIAPSAISITPNANSSADDIAVYIARNTKIKVCSKGIINIDEETSDFQEWTLSGRNRRLGDSAKPYTVYARLKSTDKSDAYLVFAAKTQSGNAWVDKYVSLSFDGTTGRQYNGYWYVRLGDVSAPVDGKRTVDLDTGILGTELFNAEWDVNPDPLPLRVEIGNSKDSGVPYVKWGEDITLNARLVEGWDNDASARVDHWTISRDSGDAAADASWLVGDARLQPFTTSGQITLRHIFGGVDDMNAAVAPSFVIRAWGVAQDDDSSDSDSSDADSSSSSAPEIVVLAQASITILSETVASYYLELSSHIVSFSPQTGEYTPADGITIRVRAKAQDGKIYYLKKSDIDRAGLMLYYDPIDSDSSGDDTELEFTGSEYGIASAVLPVSAFYGHQSQNLHLMQPVVDSDSSGETWTEADSDSVAFLRDGEDSKEREWIYLRSATPITFGTQEHPYPANIAWGQVDPVGQAAEHKTDIKDQDGWVPEGWWDEEQGVTSQYPYEYWASRDFIRDDDSSDDSSGDGGHWGPFSTPKISSHYGNDGINTATVTIYKRINGTVNQSSDKPGLKLYYKFADGKLYKDAACTQEPTAAQMNYWSLEVPATDANHYPLYSREKYVSATDAYAEVAASDWGNAVKIVEDGEKGNDGVDSVTVVTDPSTIIIRQVAKPEGNNVADFGLPMQVGLTVKDGADSNSIAITGLQEVSGETSGVTIGISGTVLTIESVVPTVTPSGSTYPTKGSFKVDISYTKNGTAKTTRVKVPVYIDPMGTIVTNIEKDVETTVAHDIGYAIDGQGRVNTLEKIGTFIRSSAEFSSELSMKINNGKNMFSGALTGNGWKSCAAMPTSGAPSPTYHDITVNANGYFVLATGDTFFASPLISLEESKKYTLSFTGGGSMVIVVKDVTNGTVTEVYSTQKSGGGRMSFTFTSNHDYDNVRVYISGSPITQPQIELGESATTFESGDSEMSSRIKQTVNEIDMSVRDDLGQVGININGANKAITVIGDKFSWKNNNNEQILGMDSGGNATFAGTVRAKDFYHRLCVVEGAGVDDKSTYNKCVSLYITDATDFKSDAEHDGFLSEVSNVQDGDVLVWDADHYPIGVQFGQTFGGTRACSGDADEVAYINTHSGQSLSNSLYLPPAASCEGKKVTVYNKNILKRGLTVYSADTTGEEIVGSCSIDNNHNIVIDSSLPGQGYFIDGGDSCSFLAVNGGWLMLAYMEAQTQNQS